MTIPHPWHTQPDTNATAAAYHTTAAIRALAEALDDGTHTLHAPSQHDSDTFLRAEADLCIGPRPTDLAVLDTHAFNALPALLVFALEDSTTRSTVLVATSAAEPRPRTCGWTIRDRWLHPMNTDALAQALNPCPGNATAVERDAYQAPSLQAPDTGEEHPRG
ncbi:hypothetical protein [Streptomyces sp. NPDC058739]|uniref:hypothetical protein n=1 Tax=Streptomyces sp. NPDC058739 TaxID=3346618 RepID=UPI0036B0EF32